MVFCVKLQIQCPYNYRENNNLKMVNILFMFMIGYDLFYLGELI